MNNMADENQTLQDIKESAKADMSWHVSSLETMLTLANLLFRSVRAAIDHESAANYERRFFTAFAISQKKETFFNLHRLTKLLLSIGDTLKKLPQ